MGHYDVRCSFEEISFISFSLSFFSIQQRHSIWIWKNQYPGDIRSARSGVNSLPLTFFEVMVDQNPESYDLGKNGVNIESPIRVTKTGQGDGSNKCNQCEYTTSQTGNLRMHVKIHSGEKSKKCNQCDFASNHAGHLSRHLKTHSGEKSNKCNQCDFASFYASNLGTHMKTHTGEKSNKCSQCDYAS